MEEAKLNLNQQRQILRSLSTPKNLDFSESNHCRYKRKSLSSPMKVRIQNSQLRSKETILASGDLDIPTYVPQNPPGNYAEKKRQFADTMAFGVDLMKDLPEFESSIDRKDPNRPWNFNDPQESQLRKYELYREIQEREEFLKEMSAAGLKKEYALLMENEIAQKYNELRTCYPSN